tara:strand:+ start:4893 stop:5483 length:591 start_codon:yes stop_codon:yes gene_type:complete
MVDSFLKQDYRANFTPGKTLPKVSTKLDAVRSYQFEVKFFGVPQEFIQTQQVLTAAAKQVSPIAGAVDEIVVDRLNDKVYYPGKFTPESVTITFDNQLLTNTTPALWNWFKTIYDPLTGDMTKLAAPGGPGNKSFKASKMTILELDNTNEPHAFIETYGVYPTGVRFSEKNYATNDFSTVEVTFRFDFVNYDKINR